MPQMDLEPSIAGADKRNYLHGVLNPLLVLARDFVSVLVTGPREEAAAAGFMRAFICGSVQAEL